MRSIATSAVLAIAAATAHAQFGGPLVPGGFERVPPLPFPTAARTFEQSLTAFRVVPVVRGLVNPWSLAFLPNGDMLVTERPGGCALSATVRSIPNRLPAFRRSGRPGRADCSRCFRTRASVKTSSYI